MYYACYFYASDFCCFVRNEVSGPQFFLSSIGLFFSLLTLSQRPSGVETVSREVCSGRSFKNRLQWKHISNLDLNLDVRYITLRGPIGRSADALKCKVHYSACVRESLPRKRQEKPYNRAYVYRAVVIPEH